MLLSGEVSSRLICLYAPLFLWVNIKNLVNWDCKETKEILSFLFVFDLLKSTLNFHSLMLGYFHL